VRRGRLSLCLLGLGRAGTLRVMRICGCSPSCSPELVQAASNSESTHVTRERAGSKEQYNGGNEAIFGDSHSPPRKHQAEFAPEKLMGPSMRRPIRVKGFLLSS